MTPVLVPGGHVVQRVLPSAAVVLRSDGAMLVPRRDGRFVPLGLADLVVLSLLADPGVDDVGAAAVAAGLDPAEVDAAVGTLAESELLIPRHAPVRELGDRPPAPPVRDDRPDPRELLALATPTVLRVGAEGFMAVDLWGRTSVVLDARDVLAATAFCQPRTVADAVDAAVVDEVGWSGLQLAELVDRLWAADLLRVVAREDAEAHGDRARQQMRAALSKRRRLHQAVNANLALLEADEAERRQRTGVRRTRVVPVHSHNGYLPLGLGMILAYLADQRGGSIERNLRIWPDWVSFERDVADLACEPAVYLFSNYLWSHADNLKLSAAIKDASPTSLTIHGGPDTPKYEADTRAYLEANPHVDVTVHGEGEVATAEVLEALADALGGDGPLDLTPLHDVPGISFMDRGRFVRTADRPRLTDLNVIPSPYLTGLYDAFRGIPDLGVVLETNRGCPYGCTFCDWGTSTMARIRKFDLERVKAELAWAAEAQAVGIALADANFGIFERDVEIAETIVELRRQHGYPFTCVASYAKNTVKHLEHIISMFIDADMLARGLLSLQSMDPTTLDAVRRSNIKTEKYDELARQFRRRGLPLYVDLMMGLPGMTAASFADDLQSCIDREVRAKIHTTELLPNSPMNEPAYRAEHAVQVRRPGQPGDPGRDMTVVATATMSEQDFDRMYSLRTPFIVGENFGVLRHLARYLRHETGQREIELYLSLVDAADDPAAWPSLDLFVHASRRLLAPPGSWALLFDEVREILVDRLGVPDDSALDTVMEVQRALVPSVGRPQVIELDLAHDYAAWHSALIDAKLAGGEWTEVVAPLRQHPPARFVASDPHRLSEHVLGVGLTSTFFDSWELDSAVARPSVLSGLASLPLPAPAR